MCECKGGRLSSGVAGYAPCGLFIPAGSFPLQQKADFEVIETSLAMNSLSGEFGKDLKIVTRK